jgi:hypothetical protein
MLALADIAADRAKFSIRIADLEKRRAEWLQKNAR